MANRRRQALLLLALLAAGCGSSRRAPSSDELTAVITRGISQIEGTHDMEALRLQLRRQIRRTRDAPATTSADRRARHLALRGFEETLHGVAHRLSFSNNDSGNIEAATRDAVSADRFFARGMTLLRAAARVLGLHEGP